MIATSTIQAYKDNTKIKRERKEDPRIQFTCLCRSLSCKITQVCFFKIFLPETSSPSFNFLCVSVCLHSPPAPNCFQVALMYGRPKHVPVPKILKSTLQNLLHIPIKKAKFYYQPKFILFFFPTKR